jgi:hypothetical protein
VVTYLDEHGTEREFTTGTSTTWVSHQPGEQVTVRFRPGHPEAARIEAGAHDTMWFAAAGLSAVLILVGLVLIGTAVPELR